MNKLDAIFKDKLSNHTMMPSAAAWDKLEAGLTKKNEGIAWMRWAAVLIGRTGITRRRATRPADEF